MCKRSRRLSRWYFFSASMLLASTLIGCQSSHEKWVNAADQRWLSVRTVLMLDMAQQQFDTGDLEQSERTVKEAMTIDPTNAQLHVLAGRIELERGHLERSYHMFNAAIMLDGTLAEAHYYQALVFQRWQNYQAAYDSYTLAYEARPDNSAYLIARGEMLVSLGRIDEAIVLLEEKLNYFDQNASLRAAIGHMYDMNGQDDKAVSYFRQASILDPDNLKVVEELGLSQIAAEQYEQGIETLTRLLAKAEMQDRHDLKRVLASAYIEVGRLQDARDILIEVSRKDPADVDNWIELGELAWKNRDYGGTLQAAHRVISLAPYRHEGYLLAGMVWQKRGRVEDALSNYDQAAQLAPNSAMPLILRGITLQKEGRNQAAAEAYRQSLQREPDNIRAKKLLQMVADASQ